MSSPIRLASSLVARDPVDDVIELSVVIPCLNEAETLPGCIETVKRAFQECGVSGEIIVADNGSTDRSAEIAAGLGARVITVTRKGYGRALRGGIAAARGHYIILGDADGSHDLSQIPGFLAKLREGFDLVVGNRFRGSIAPGAMRRLHRYFGSPALAALVRLFFGAPCGDPQCGFRGFSRHAFAEMRLRSSGMEFASEMVARAACLRLSIAELPTSQAPSGRRRPAHLRTWRDGWRHLRWMLLHSPRWLFLYPGVLLMAAGLIVGAWLLPGPRTIAGVTFDIHTLLYASTALLVGFESVAFAAFTKICAIRDGLLPHDARFERLLRAFSLELGLIAGSLLLLLGFVASVYAVSSWGAQHWGDLDPTRTMRLIIPAALAMALGGEIVLSSFFFSVLRLGDDTE